MADPAPALRPVRPGIHRLVSAFSESGLQTPSFVLDESQFHHNGRILQQVQERTGCKILLAQKAFSSWCVYPVLRQYLVGTAASGLYEARLGREDYREAAIRQSRHALARAEAAMAFEGDIARVKAAAEAVGG